MALAIDAIDGRGPSNETRRQLLAQKACKNVLQTMGI